jgi:HD-GYP domain-containing protein (c-di-GMP phosphodiesterase class II)
MARQHHERLDGSGYPRGLVGEQILPEARILAVADVVEAMMSHRPYRPAIGLQEALAEIESGSGTKYEPAVVDVCRRMFQNEGFQLR